MAWFKVDDGLYSHPKWLGLSKGARSLWVTAGSWSAAQLTDGKVPESVLPILGGNAREATELASAGLWRPISTGWRFHDWDDYQPTRRDVLDRRARSAERIRKWREQRATGQEGQSV